MNSTLTLSAAAARFFPDSLVLPSMPEVATKLMRSFGDDNLNLDTLAGLIGKDASLSAKVLRLANSARYSPSHNIDTLRDAAAALGVTTLRNLVMAACMASAFPAVEGMDRKKFWRHSLATAAFATLLAKAEQINTEVAYLAGLMLRSGQLLMLQVEPGAVAEAESHVIEPGVRFDWEMNRFGVSHNEVTAELARRWHFPHALVEGFHWASDPLSAKPFSLLGAVLHMAEVLADAMELGIAPVKALEQIEKELVEHEHLDLDWLEGHLFTQADLAHEVELLLAG
jgi:HD-like signal output (HDOD) protein